MNWWQMDNDATTKWESLCTMDNERGKAQQNFEQDKESSEDYTVQRLELFRSNMSVRFLYSIFEYSPKCTEDDEADATVNWGIFCITALCVCTLELVLLESVLQRRDSVYGVGRGEWPEGVR